VKAFLKVFLYCTYEQCALFNKRLMGRTAQIGHQTTSNLSLILLVAFQEYNNLTFQKFQVAKKCNTIRKAKSVLIKTFKFD